MSKQLLSTILICCLASGILVFSSFQQNPLDSVSITQQIKQQYLQDLETFRDAVSDLTKVCQDFEHDQISKEDLRNQVVHTRYAFKKIEYLVEYYDPEFVKLYINGAPLPRLSPDDNRSIEAPEGLQTLNELIFADDPSAEKEQIAFLANQLEQKLTDFLPYQEQVPIYHRHIFEAARSELIRIFALGLTGFDTPGSSNAIPEAEIALAEIHQAIRLYTPLLKERNKKTKLHQTLDKQFENALTYLAENQDFDSFDRLQFLTTHLNPLYATLLKAHRILGIETMYEANPQISKFSVNYFADNLFSDSLINPFFYTEQLASQQSEKAIELGRYLFFDPILSDKLERSCASCHQPDKAFTDGLAKSIARDFDGTVNRNAPTLINAVYSPRFFYDLRANKLESQIHHVLFEEKEFNSNFFKTFERLQQSPEYMQLFREAFPQHKANPIHRYTLGIALSSYIISLKGFNSPFDQYARGESTELSESSKRGFNLFMGKAGCGTCHFAPTFNGLVPPHYKEIESEILGVPASEAEKGLDTDVGRFEGYLQEQQDIYKHSFKTMSVRNVALTAPYMHNGVYSSLEEVMAFYNHGGGIGLGYDVPNQTLPPDSLGLDSQEIQDVITFMTSLTDTTGLTKIPQRLPAFPEGSPYQDRVIGGKY